MTSYPLRAALHSSDTAGRMMKWAVELGEYGLEYQPRTAIKSQVLADFVAEFTGVKQGLASEPNAYDQLDKPNESDKSEEPNPTGNLEEPSAREPIQTDQSSEPGTNEPSSNGTYVEEDLEPA